MRFASHVAETMADELDLDQLDTDIEKEHRESKRNKDLSEKVKLTSEERDEKDRLLKEQETKTSELQKERDFYAGFSDVVSANPMAKDHKDDILAKVKSGYTVEDATFAVLGKAGKLGQQKTIESAPISKENPAGGSAPNQPMTGGAKPVDQMSREEKRAALIEAEARGDLGVN